MYERKIGVVKKRNDESKRRGDYAHKDRQRGLCPQRQMEGTVPMKTDRGDYTHKKI